MRKGEIYRSILMGGVPIEISMYIGVSSLAQISEMYSVWGTDRFLKLVRVYKCLGNSYIASMVR